MRRKIFVLSVRIEKAIAKGILHLISLKFWSRWLERRVRATDDAGLDFLRTQ